MRDKLVHHFSLLQDYLYQLYKNQSLCDLSLITRNGTTLLAHKLVVAAFSGAVRNEVEKWKDILQVCVVVDCEDVILKEILEFIYTGKVGNKEELFPLLNDASGRLQLTSLQNYLHEEYQYSGEPEQKPFAIHNSLHTPIATSFSGEMVSADSNCFSDNSNENKVTEKIYTGENTDTSMAGNTCNCLLDSLKENKNTEETHSDENACLLVNSKESYSIDKAFDGDSDSTLMPPTDNVTKRMSEDKHFLREKKTIQSYYQEHFNDSDWSDDVELNNFSDDESKDETWNMESEIKQKGNIQMKIHLKEAYVKLVRIDTTKHGNFHIPVSSSTVQEGHSMIKSKYNPQRTLENVNPKINTLDKRKKKARKTVNLNSRNQQHKRYTRKKLTRLSQIKQTQNLLKMRRPLFTFSKTCIRKVTNSLRKCLKKKSAVYKAEKISKYYKKQQIVGALTAASDEKKNRRLSNSQRQSERVIASRKDKRSKMKRKMDKIKKKISKLECFLCERKYKNVRNLSTHLIEKHKYTSVKTQKLTGYPKYFAVKTLTKPVCKECNEEFINLSDFRSHCRSVHNKRKLDPDIACTQKGCAEKFRNMHLLKKHLMQFHQLEDTGNLMFGKKEAKLLLNTTKLRGFDDESTDETWNMESEHEQIQSILKKKDEAQNAKVDVSLKKINTTEHLKSNAGLHGTKPQNKRYTRENLARLSRIKQRRNLLKRRKPSFTFSKQSIRKMRKSLEEYLRKKSDVYRAGKISKYYKNQQFLVENNKFGYVCKICNFWSKFASVVKLHAEKHRKKIAKGIFASMKFKRVTKMRKMDKIKKKVLQLVCFVCDRKYKNIRNLTTHLMEKHKYTSSKTQRLTGYPRYFAVNTPTKPVCSECNEEFSNLLDYRTHCRSVHKKKRLDPDIPCTEKGCTYRFINLHSLKTHLTKFHRLENAAKLTFRPKDAKLLLNTTKLIGVKKRKEMTDLRRQKLNNYDHVSNCMKNKKNKKELNEKVASDNSKFENQTTKKRNYNCYLPSKAYTCNICVKPIKCHHKLVYKNHEEVAHKNMFVSKQFMSKVIVKKCLFLNFPSTNDFARISPKSESQQVTLQQKITRFSDDKEYISPVENSCGSNMHKVSDVQITHQNTKNNIDKKNDTCLIKTEIQNPWKLNMKINECENVLDILADKRPYICMKCGLSFSLYSKLCLHFTKSHVHLKQPFRQKQIMAKVVKHVTVRKRVFARKARSGKKSYMVKRPGKLKCDICNKTFSQIRPLRKHMIDAHQYENEKARHFTRNSSSDDSNKKSNHYDNSWISDKPCQTKSRRRLSCTVCHKSFTEVRSVANHLQNLHRYTFEQAREATGYPSFSFKNNFGLKERKCKLCSETFIMLKDLKRHRVEVHGIICKYCNEKFGNKFILKRHGMREHSDHYEEFASMKIKNTNHYTCEDEEDIESKQETVYSCEKCQYSSTKMGYLKFHIIENHPEIEHPCPVCGRTFRHKLLLEGHIAKFHGVGGKTRFSCVACDKTFCGKENLRIHQLKVHGIPHPSLKEYKCDFEGCNKVYYVAYQLQNHQATHVETSVNYRKKFSCTHCDYVCYNRSSLDRHVKKIHLKSKKVLCDLCGKVFTDTHHLKTHVKLIHSNGQFRLQCEFCSFQTIRRSNLWNHSWHLHQKRMADDHRQYSQCDRCAFQSPMLRRLKNHLNAHYDTRNYECDQCDAKFRTSATLKTHKIWKHSSATEEKCCPHCSYRTKTTSRLSEHIRVQHQLKDVKPYRCGYCDFRCATNANCRKHVIGKHKGLPVKLECDKEYLEIARMERSKGNTLALDTLKQKTTD